MRLKIVACTAMFVLLAMGSVRADQFQQTAVDVDTIKPYQDNNYNSTSSIYSYYEDDYQNKHTAFMKFDLSSIPDGSTFDSMSLQLSTKLLVVFASPNPNTAHILHSTNDAWSSTTNDPYPGTNEEVGAPKVVVSQFTFYTWDLDPGAFDYQADLTDNTLTLAINATHYVDWFGNSDFGQEARYPQLTIQYTPVPEPATLALVAIAGLIGGSVLTRRKPERSVKA